MNTCTCRNAQASNPDDEIAECPVEFSAQAVSGSGMIRAPSVSCNGKLSVCSHWWICESRLQVPEAWLPGHFPDEASWVRYFRWFNCVVGLFVRCRQEKVKADEVRWSPGKSGFRRTACSPRLGELSLLLARLPASPPPPPQIPKNRRMPQSSSTLPWHQQVGIRLFRTNKSHPQ